MPQVKLARGKQLQCEATLGLLRRIKRIHGIDLLSRDVKVFAQFLSQSEVCWPVVCEFYGLQTPEAQEELAEVANGADVAALIRGVNESLRDFFQSSGEPEMAAALEKAIETIQAGRNTLAKRITETDLVSEVTREILSMDLSPGNSSIPQPAGSD
jgi:hypothetical protein